MVIRANITMMRLSRVDWLFLLRFTLWAGIHTGSRPSPGEIQANPLCHVNNFPGDQAFVSRSCHEITVLVVFVDVAWKCHSAISFHSLCRNIQKLRVNKALLYILYCPMAFPPFCFWVICLSDWLALSIMAYLYGL